MAEKCIYTVVVQLFRLALIAGLQAKYFVDISIKSVETCAIGTCAIGTVLYIIILDERV